MLKPGDKVTEEDLKRAENRVSLALASVKKAAQDMKDAEAAVKKAQAEVVEIQTAIKYNGGLIIK